ncbi:hypothetical protein [Gordonia iterans]
MTDPAADAARRAWLARGATEQEREDSVADDDCVSTFANEFAREALAPIRELHTPVRVYMTLLGEPVWRWECGECDDRPWPCDTARLIYTSSELEER